MTIGVDIRVLGTGRKSGIEEYTEQLLAHLIPLDSSVQYKLFYSSYNVRLKSYPWLELPNVRLYDFKIPNRLLFYSSQFIGLPKLDRLMGGVDVMFSPHFFLAPVSAGVRRVVTFHDLSFERFPEFLSWRRHIWHRLQMRPQLQALKADRIIAVSDSTRADLIELYSLPEEKVRRIYSGVSYDMKRSDGGELQYFRTRNHFGRRFILALGTLEPRKNIAGLISAFELVKGREDLKDIQLVLAGAKGWLYESTMRAIEHSRYSKDIRLVDISDDSERSLYYSAASVLAYPSFFEGFGFPPLEAMACGTPVVASNQSSLPETLGNATLLVDPYNISEMAGSLTSVLEDPDLGEQLRERGYRQVKKFSWQLCAQETLETLRMS